MYFDNLFQELSNEEVIEKAVFERIKKRRNSLFQLVNIATTLYSWKNLSDNKVENANMSLNIERACMLSGFCGFVKVMGKLFPLPFVPSTVPSLEFRPTQGMCVGYNGSTYQVNALDAPILKNTPFGWSALPVISDYSERLELIDTTSMGLVNAMQVPFIIRTPDGDSQNEVANEITNALRQHRPVIVKDSAVANAFDKEISVLNTNVDSDGISKLTSYRSECFAQFMRYLGVSDMTGEKRERLLVGEVNLSAQSGGMLQNPFEISRDESAEYLSEYFGRKITYEKNEKMLETYQNNMQRGGFDNYGNKQIEEMG